jgi:hypothetical protein
MREGTVLIPSSNGLREPELTDEACPTYKNLLVGRSQRIPSRQTLMQIAEYLECSMESRNNLLLAARYLAFKPRIGRRRAQDHMRTGQAVDGNTPLSSLVRPSTFLQVLVSLQECTRQLCSSILPSRRAFMTVESS